MSNNESRLIKEKKIENPEKVMLRYKETGDIGLRNQLVMHYLQYVNIAIYSMRSILLSNIPFDDFFNQGIIALIDCIERYDPSRGASFDTYSYMGIRGSILKYLRKQNWLPNRVWEARKRISQGRLDLEQELLREPTDKELAEHLEMTEKQLISLISEITVVETVSFEELLENTYSGVSENTGLISDIDISDNMMQQELLGALAEAIDKLPPKQKQVVSLYYYENLNLREIGEVLDVSQQRVSQIRSRALDALKEAMQDYGAGKAAIKQ
ncbi:MAG: FliA/WhiG family RNA polymerase sigma factor [Oscillospiraceae bacterium]|nr:FliA/WhiG family RNA polymerase sigma factor [Oscillospiraceae bacterium]